MNHEQLMEHEGIHLTQHTTELDERLPEWEIMLQYFLFEEKPDREKFYVALFHRSSGEEYVLEHAVTSDGDATIEKSEELVTAVGALDYVDDDETRDELVELLLSRVKEALEGYASVLFMQGQCT